MARRVHADRRLMTTVHVVMAFVYVHALGPQLLLAAVPRLATAVVPAGHVDALRGAIVTPVQTRRALVQVLFTSCSNEAHEAVAGVGRHAPPTIQTSVFAHSYGDQRSQLESCYEWAPFMYLRSQENPSPV